MGSEGGADGSLHPLPLFEDLRVCLVYDFAQFRERPPAPVPKFLIRGSTHHPSAGGTASLIAFSARVSCRTWSRSDYRLDMRYLVTSALPYINGVKHLGNLVGSMLPADVYARFLRARGRNVLFLCATDEHGTPAELAAAEAGLSVNGRIGRTAPPFRTSAKVRYVKSRLTGNAAAGNA
jgi:tRNA synthetase class I (M)